MEQMLMSHEDEIAMLKFNQDYEKTHQRPVTPVALIDQAMVHEVEASVSKAVSELKQKSPSNLKSSHHHDPGLTPSERRTFDEISAQLYILHNTVRNYTGLLKHFLQSLEGQNVALLTEDDFKNKLMMGYLRVSKGKGGLDLDDADDEGELAEAGRKGKTKLQRQMKKKARTFRTQWNKLTTLAIENQRQEDFARDNFHQLTGSTIGNLIKLFGHVKQFARRAKSQAKAQGGLKDYSGHPSIRRARKQPTSLGSPTITSGYGAMTSPQDGTRFPSLSYSPTMGKNEESSSFAVDVDGHRSSHETMGHAPARRAHGSTISTHSAVSGADSDEAEPIEVPAITSNWMDPAILSANNDVLSQSILSARDPKSISLQQSVREPIPQSVSVCLSPPVSARGRPRDPSADGFLPAISPGRAAWNASGDISDGDHLTNVRLGTRVPELVEVVDRGLLRRQSGRLTASCLADAVACLAISALISRNMAEIPSPSARP
eukprot:gene295-367_t